MKKKKESIVVGLWDKILIKNLFPPFFPLRHRNYHRHTAHLLEHTSHLIEMVIKFYGMYIVVLCYSLWQLLTIFYISAFFYIFRFYQVYIKQILWIFISFDVHLLWTYIGWWLVRCDHGNESVQWEGREWYDLQPRPCSQLSPLIEHCPPWRQTWESAGQYYNTLCHNKGPRHYRL